MICGTTFTTRHNTGRRRATCSEDCKRDCQARNVERATRARLEKHRKATAKRLHHHNIKRIRRHWQAKAELQDQYFAEKRARSNAA